MAKARTKPIFESARGRPILQDVAQLIQSGKVKRVCTLTGAGISTSAGIPDFRSPKTGLYANLEKYKLPYAEAVFDIEYFVDKPEPFFALAKELWPANYEPTPSHYFFKLLEDRKLLLRAFTQNIDTLERRAGVSDDKIVEAHGSFATATCLKCRKKHTAEQIKDRIMQGQVLRCTETSCKGKKRALIKSDIVFFGEALPSRFHQRISDLEDCDLLIVMGTSLTVHPFASLVNAVPDECPRVLINLEAVGEMGDFSMGTMGMQYSDGFDFDGRARGGPEKARDVLYLGKCDDGVRELVEALGWTDDFEKLCDANKRSRAQGSLTSAEGKADEVSKEVADLTGALDATKLDEPDAAPKAHH
ncbi:uncharacterized protein L969DRAFT_78833 [Mixia osmundae IAM 14324]|uniref:NAD-dependent protein deacetylase n=1 Tax=Mixia osmundae (strain CBS 9802 / IAM 14324 / JCM 22182 / KY 12970) TaxID=764103 RepID=G7DU15_MIXOS|nr:uncharacterized protein L969DRAFT_78833 [Mixia osmundae IAM 14324]KEI37083.1 hypothetical protein L969DRAFT_78833 [Mixia osmundae IAM 14324]GAA94075.1 hypothetical protein E5Q_00722 [Mixia osmundae IAM 14324]